MKEKLDVFNVFGMKVLRSVTRGEEELKRHEYTKAIHVWLQLLDDRILVQKRSSKKSYLPGVWTAVGGAVSSGEKVDVSAIRETHEEMGLIFKNSEYKFIKTVISDSIITYVYRVKADFHEDEIKLDKREVEDYKFITLTELFRDIDNGSFHNYEKKYGEGYFKGIFDFND